LSAVCLLALSGCEQYKEGWDENGGYILISGCVLDASSGVSVSGAKITVYAEAFINGTEQRSEDGICTTDAKGRFSIRMRPYPINIYDQPYFSFSVEHRNYQNTYKGFDYCSGVKIYATRIK